MASPGRCRRESLGGFEARPDEGRKKPRLRALRDAMPRFAHASALCGAVGADAGTVIVTEPVR